MTARPSTAEPRTFAEALGYTADEHCSAQVAVDMLERRPGRRSLAEIRKAIGGDWETPESVDRAAQIRELWVQARHEQRWVPNVWLPLTYVEAVYEAYDFARQHVDRESAMRHANRALAITTRAAKDWGFDIGMSLVRDLCATFDRAHSARGGE